ncbi:MAG: hypothetical protein HY427_00515 [Candidatus Levybacteria bacterium]|nr:hypothetical protein [Candidatus Levybacteria bacterium]
MPASMAGLAGLVGVLTRLHVPVSVRRTDQIQSVPNTLLNMADSTVPGVARMRLLANHIVKVTLMIQHAKTLLNRAGFPVLVGVTQGNHAQVTANRILKIPPVPHM